MEIISANFQSNMTNSVPSSQVETSIHHIELGQWWQVAYDGEVFPGELTEVRENECKVLVVVPAGNVGNGRRKRMKSITNYPAS